MVNPGPNGNSDGLCQLSEAIRAANTNLAVDGCIAGQSGGTDTIVLQAAGPYRFTQVDNFAVGSSALPVVTSSILINAQNNELTRDPLGPNLRLFIVQAGNLTISSISDVNSGNGLISDGDGGFAYVENGTLTITQCDLRGYFATSGHFGGTVALVNSTLNVTDSSFFGGTTDGGGGKINGSASTIVITNSQMQFSSTSGDGGVIRCFTNCNTTVVDSYLHGGATNGGAIATDSPVSLTRVWIDQANAGFTGGGAGRGGAIDSSGSLTIQDSLFTNNIAGGSDTALGEGGAIYSTGTLTMSGTTIHSNAATGDPVGPGARGGALYVGGTATITNSTINGNNALLPGSGGQGGAGIFVRNTATLVLNNVTLTLNSGGSGIVREAGGAGTVTLRNSIIALNVGEGVPLNQPPSDCIGTFISQGHNLISFNTGCTFTPASGDIVGTPASPVNPVVGVMDSSAGKTVGCTLAVCSPTQNGTQTQISTRRLLITSPAIDAGDTATCASPDQNDIARPVGGACDIGAWEGAGIVPVVDIALTKSGAPDPVAVGGTLTYMINIDLTPSADNPPAVVVTDTLPAGVTFVSATASIPNFGTGFSNCTEAAGVVTCTFSSMLRGFLANAGSVVIVVQPTASAVSPLINTASVTSQGTEADNTNNSATATTTVSGGGTDADLSVTKTDSPDPVILGQGNITYTVVVTNNGPGSASNVMLTDTLPAGVTFVSVMPGAPICTQAGGVVTCDIGALIATGSMTITIAITPTAAGVLTNTASVTATEADPTPANNMATATTTVNPSADLSVTKSDSPDPVVVNNNLTYTLTVNNAGPSAATTVTLTDVLPANTTFQSITPAIGWTCATPAIGAGGTVTCTIANFASGAPAAVFMLVVRPTAAGMLSNTTTVASPVFDPGNANNSNTATTTVNAAPPDFSLSVSPTTVAVDSGQSATATVTVTPNPAPFASSVALDCPNLPHPSLFCSFSPASGTPNSNPLMSQLSIATRTMPAASPILMWRTLPPTPLWFPLLALCLALLALRGRARWPRLHFALLVLLLATLLPQVACQGEGAARAPAGNYTITISGTSGNVTHTTSLTLTVR